MLTVVYTESRQEVLTYSLTTLIAPLVSTLGLDNFRHEYVLAVNANYTINDEALLHRYLCCVHDFRSYNERFF